MRAILFASALIVLAFASAPSLFERYLDQPQTQRMRAPDRAFPATMDDARMTSSDEVEIRAESDGHFYVEAMINFSPVRVMVDTGASVVALRQSDAEAAGIRFVSADFQHPVQTANGTTNAAQAVLDSVAVDNIEVFNVRALVIPDDLLSVSLLGGSFLHSLERVEVSDGRLVFEN